ATSASQWRFAQCRGEVLGSEVELATGRVTPRIERHRRQPFPQPRLIEYRVALSGGAFQDCYARAPHPSVVRSLLDRLVERIKGGRRPGGWAVGKQSAVHGGEPDGVRGVPAQFVHQVRIFQQLPVAGAPLARIEEAACLW